MRPSILRSAQSRTLGLPSEVILLYLAVTLSLPIPFVVAEDSTVHDHEGLFKDLRSGYEQLVDHYVPDFVGVDRSIIGRATDDNKALANNAPGRSNIGQGENQYYVLPKSVISGPKSPSTTGLPSLVKQRDIGLGPQDVGAVELRKRQTSEAVVYITLNTCLQPNPKTTNPNGSPSQLNVYVSTSSTNQKPSVGNNNAAMIVDGGYGIYNLNATNDLYITVVAPKSDQFAGSYEYELTASIDAPYASYIDETFTRFVDSDGDTALLTTNDTTSLNSSSDVFREWMGMTSVFSLFVQNQENPTLSGLQKSMCALQKLAQTQGPSNINNSMTLHGDGQPKQRFLVSNLNSSSAYYAVTGIVGNGTKSGGSVVNGGGTVWKNANFTTQSGRYICIATTICLR